MKTPNLVRISYSLLALFTYDSLVYKIQAEIYTDTPVRRAEASYRTLQEWYDASTGLYNSTGWWNAANVITTLSSLALVDSTLVDQIQGILENTFEKAPAAKLAGYRKAVDPATFLISSTSVCDDFQLKSNDEGDVSSTGDQDMHARDGSGWLNDYYDDEAWWALAWIRAYDLTSNATYLEAAIDISEDLELGATTPCGGIWWDKQHSYINAIANELYLAVAASMANRVANLTSSSQTPRKAAGQVLLNEKKYAPSRNGKGRDVYLAIAMKQWDWFVGSGMINAHLNINDGLTRNCDNNNGTVWSYNQGVILEALSELYLATANISYISAAIKIAEAAIESLTTSEGILKDACETWGCGADGIQFKGVFVRGLSRLLCILDESEVKSRSAEFLKVNANSIWQRDRDSKGRIGVIWSGPVKEVNAGSHSSGLDALVAANGCIKHERS